jgi:pimeloyl-ACP methyl ester carboxylesterase
MNVVHDGPREAPPLLLVHGSGFSGASWAPMVPALAAHHHVIRVDLMGSNSYDVPAAADRIAAALDRAGLRAATVAGHSSGGYVATALAESRPDLVRALALISTGPSPDALLPQPLLLRALLAPPLGPIIWPRRTDAMIRKGISATCARPVEIPDALVADVRGVSYDEMRTVLRRNTEYIAARPIPARLTTLTVPALIIFGRADRRWNPASADQYDGIPGARVERLLGVGHIPMLEAPDETSSLLLTFAANPTGRN